MDANPLPKLRLISHGLHFGLSAKAAEAGSALFRPQKPARSIQDWLKRVNLNCSWWAEADGPVSWPEQAAVELGSARTFAIRSDSVTATE